MSDANSSMRDMPWYVRAITIVGVTSGIAIYLVWFLTHTMAAQLDAQALALRDHAAASSSLGDTLRLLEQDHRQSNSRIEVYMRLMCEHAAKPGLERDACASVR